MLQQTELPRALALVGMPGAGKTICAKHLEDLGYFQLRFGGVVEGEVRARGWDVTPDNERIVREELREQYGMAAMAVISLPKLQAALAEHSHIIIDGLYSFSEYKILQQQLGVPMVVVAITATRHLRYERLAKRDIRPLTPEEATVRDIQEIERIEKGGPIAIADYTLLNDGSPDELLQRLDAVLEALDFRP
jgi:dephospho-CoA kinase